MLFHLLSSFQPFENPIGFGASDFLELFLAAALGSLFLFRPALERALPALGQRTAWTMLLFASLPLALRLLLVPHHPFPSPESYQDFGNLLVADTVRHLRLTNPPHAFHRFFETLGVLQEPRYASITRLGPGLILAFGALLGHPWIGIALITALFSSLFYWMLRGFTTPGWAFAGGLLAVFLFGPLSPWMNSYAAGALPAVAGCLVFGSLPRIADRSRARDALSLGLGLGLTILTQPLVSLFLFASAILFLTPKLRSRLSTLIRTTPVLLAPVLLAAALTLLQNHSATGGWTTSPASQHQSLHQMKSATPETLATYLSRLEFRIRWYRFFLLAPLYIALLFFLIRLRNFQDVWLLSTLALAALGANFEPALDWQSLAVAAPLLLLMAVKGLDRLSRAQISNRPIGREAARFIVFLCAAHFLFWYGLHLLEPGEVAAAMLPYETWDSIDRPHPGRRPRIENELARSPGRQLVFVRYSPVHNPLDEWVFNAADIDASRIVWARDLGPANDQALCGYYPDRRVWLLEPDETPPALRPFTPAAEPLHAETSKTEPPKPKAKPNISPFEPIR